ncbi:hypothetical protein HDZ31DRAFT_65905 [Schizophyllum fasciatum]
MEGLNCVLLASLTVLAFDTVATFADQVDYVLTPPYSYGTLLYLLLRLFPFVDGIMAVELTFAHPSAIRCRTENRIVTCVIVIGILLSEGVLALRTYALYNRTRWISYVLGGIWMCTVVPALVITGLELASLEYHYSPLPGCHYAHASPIIIGAYLLLVVSETAVLGLTIAMAIRHLRRATRAAHGWVFKLYRDGVVFYMSVVLISLLNVLLPIIDADYANWLASPQHTIHGICSCRILMLILKQRRASRSRARSGRTTSTVPTTALDTDDAILSTMPTAWITTDDDEDLDKPPGIPARGRPRQTDHERRENDDTLEAGTGRAPHARGWGHTPESIELEAR